MTLQPTTTCARCGKPVYRPPKRLVSGETITCSIECKAALMRKSKEPNVACEWCGKEFYRLESQLENAKHIFCSSDCCWAYKRAQHKPNAVCERCGKAFYRIEYDLNRSKGTFCSYACSGASRQLRETRPCAVCGVPVTRTQAQLRKGRHGKVFCCRDHAIAWQLEQLGPNGLEQDFAEALPDLTYVGDGNLWIYDNEGGMNPDFHLSGTRKLVELWGTYWHRDDIPQARIDRLARAGWEAIVIWEGEFRDDPLHVVERVLSFLGMPRT